MTLMTSRAPIRVEPTDLSERSQLIERMRSNAAAASAMLNPMDPAANATFPVSPSITMLNHGSYGVTPHYVRTRQNEIRDLMDQDPPAFYFQHLERLTDRTRVALADFINCDPCDIAPVTNGTSAMALPLRDAVARMNAGDEILLTNGEYQATRNELAVIAQRAGVIVRDVELPLPLNNESAVIDAITNAITPRTKLIVMSHVISSLAIIMPADAVCELGRNKGIDILIDGAHGPGQLPLNLKTMRPTYYAASCHKWLGAPKGSGFVYVDPSRQQGFMAPFESCRTHKNRPERPSFLCDFDYVGTIDASANLVIPDAIAHLGAQLNGGWPALRDRNHAMVCEAAAMLRERLGDRLAWNGRIAPDNHFGSMHSIPLPYDEHAPAPTIYDDWLWDTLWNEHQIQIPVVPMPNLGIRAMRLSAHLYNTPEQYQRLADVLDSILR